MTASTGSVTPSRRAPSSPIAVAIVAPIAVGCCAFGAAVFVAAVDPASTGAYPVCAVRSVTGLWCPGCGLTRATHHLLRGDIGEALGDNVLAFPLLAMLIVTWGAWMVGSLGVRVRWMHRAAVPTWFAVGIIAILFAIVRNLEPFAALRG